MAGDRHSVSVIIPAFNEAGNIATVMSETLDVCQAITDDYEVIVVDDVSTDATASIVEDHSRADRQIRLIRNTTRMGCHPSELKGMQAATKDLLAFIPADLQIRPSAVATMVAGIGDGDIVIAVRRRRRDHVARRAMASMYALVVRLVFGIRLKDLDSATLYTRQLISEIGPLVDPTQPFIPVEVAWRAVRLQKRIRQVEVDHYPRTSGTPAAITPGFLIRLPFRFLGFAWRCWRIRSG